MANPRIPNMGTEPLAPGETNLRTRIAGGKPPPKRGMGSLEFTSRRPGGGKPQTHANRAIGDILHTMAADLGQSGLTVEDRNHGPIPVTNRQALAQSIWKNDFGGQPGRLEILEGPSALEEGRRRLREGEATKLVCGPKGVMPFPPWKGQQPPPSAIEVDSKEAMEKLEALAGPGIFDKAPHAVRSRYPDSIQGLRLAARTHDISPRLPELRSFRNGCAELSRRLDTAHVFRFDPAASAHATGLSMRPDLLADRLHAFELPFDAVLIEVDNAASYEVRTLGRQLTEDAPPWSGYLVHRLQGHQHGCVITSVGPADGPERMYGVAPYSYVVHPEFYGINQCHDLVLQVAESYLRLGKGEPGEAASGDDEAGLRLLEEMEAAFRDHSEVSTNPRQHGAMLAWTFGAQLGYREDLLHALRLMEHTGVILNKFTGSVVADLWDADPEVLYGFRQQGWDRREVSRQPRDVAIDMIAHDLRETCGDLPRALGALLALDAERRSDSPAVTLSPPQRPRSRLRKGSVTTPMMIEQTVRLRLDAPAIPPRPSTGFGVRQKQHTRRGHWCYRHRPPGTSRCHPDRHQWITIEPPPPEGRNHKQRCELCGEFRWHRRDYVAGDPRLGTIVTNYEVTP